MSSPFNKAAGLLQQVGKSLMFPVAILPVAGILRGVGGSNLSFIPDIVSQLMAAGGSAIFNNLALIFAVGVALGLTSNEGSSALSAVVGFLVMTATLGIMGANVLGLSAASDAEEMRLVLGIATIDTGVFGGIIIGCLAALMYNRYYRMELPPYLAFFAGKRFVPIVTGIAAIAVAVVLSVIWPPIGRVIQIFSNWAAYSSPVLAGALYGFVERLLLPLGLHHVWNVPFFFEIGSYQIPGSDIVVHGDMNRFFEGDPTAGIMGGGFLVKMWGLPMAAIAMWRAAKPERRVRVGGVMLSAALTSVLTGITEPIEFAFMFAAPVLYVIHAVLTGAAFALINIFDAHIGYTFTQGGIDFVLYYAKDTRPWIVFILGPMYGALYFVVFTAVIKIFNLQTPGREPEEAVDEELSALLAEEDGLSRQIVLALGGRDNINVLGNCITRLRVDVAEPKLVDAPKLKALGAAGVVKRGTAVQAVFGTRVGNIKSDIDEYLTKAGSDAILSEERRQRLLADTREAEGAGEFSIQAAPDATQEELDKVLGVLGGAGNIEAIAPIAATRLSAKLKNKALADIDAAKLAGLPLLVPSHGDEVQVIVGSRPERYRGLRPLVAGSGAGASEAP